MYECLVGFPPFCSDKPHETFHKILRWRESLFIPDEVILSFDSVNLLQKYHKLIRFLCDAPNRIRIDALKVHPFFFNLEWEKLHTFRPPFVPKLQSITDTSHFDIDEDMALIDDDIGPATIELARNPNKDLAFVGYTFKRWETIAHEL